MDNFFNYLVKYYLKTYNNVQKITSGQPDYYEAGCLIDYLL